MDSLDLYASNSCAVFIADLFEISHGLSTSTIPKGAFLYSRLLSRLRRPVGRFNTELLGVLRVQPLPAAERHRLTTGDAADGSSAEKAIQNIETNVPARGTPRDEAVIDVVPQRQARAATKSFEFPPRSEERRVGKEWRSRLSA